MAMLHALTAKPKNQTTVSTSKGPRPRSSLLAFAGGFLAAIPLSVAAIIPMVNSQMASVAKGNHTVQIRTAADNLSCSQPSEGGAGGGEGGVGGGGAGGQVLGESTVANPPTGGGGAGGSGGGGNNQTPPPFVQQLVKVNGSITGPTGPDSNNVVSSTVTETTTVNNNNDINVSNSNDQTATSGSAEVEHNTTGGSAVSGDAWNTNSTNLGVSVTN